MAELNGKKYEEWEEYINYKFPTDEFDISEDKDILGQDVTKFKEEQAPDLKKSFSNMILKVLHSTFCLN